MTESAICRRPPKEHPGARALNLGGNGFKDCGHFSKGMRERTLQRIEDAIIFASNMGGTTIKSSLRSLRLQAFFILKPEGNMKITDELINYIGDLSRLYLSDEDKERRKSDLSDILDYVEKLNELDTKGMPEMSQPFENVNCFREDTVTNEDKRDELLANAPERKGSYFKVFKTVDQ